MVLAGAGVASAQAPGETTVSSRFEAETSKHNCVAGKKISLYGGAGDGRSWCKVPGTTCVLREHTKSRTQLLLKAPVINFLLLLGQRWEGISRPSQAVVVPAQNPSWKEGHLKM